MKILTESKKSLSLNYKLKKRFLNIRTWKLYLMVLPIITLLFLFNYVPMYGLTIAFKDFQIFKGIEASPWVGTKHFVYFLKDSKFWEVMRNTLLINFYDLIFGFTSPILFALLANEIMVLRVKKIVQTVSYLPYFLSWVIVSGIVIQLLSPETGVVNSLLKMLGVKPVFFMTDTRYFRGVLVVTDIWKSMGWNAILYFATIAGIDSSLYEAVVIDGGGRIRQVIHITLPLLMPIIQIMLLLRVSNIFNIGFERIFVLQNPTVYSVSDVISTYVYRLGLLDAQYSLTTAIGFTQSILGMALLICANSLSKKLSGHGLY